MIHCLILAKFDINEMPTGTFQHMWINILRIYLTSGCSSKTRSHRECWGHRERWKEHCQRSFNPNDLSVWRSHAQHSDYHDCCGYHVLRLLDSKRSDLGPRLLRLHHHRLRQLDLPVDSPDHVLLLFLESDCLRCQVQGFQIRVRENDAENVPSAAASSHRWIEFGCRHSSNGQFGSLKRLFNLSVCRVSLRLAFYSTIHRIKLSYQ